MYWESWLLSAMAAVIAYTVCMSIPKFHEFMLPILELTDDGAIHNPSELVSKLTAAFDLSEDQRKQRIPSGKQTVIYNRVTWGITYLRKAALLESVSRGQYRITAMGRSVLENPPSSITKAWLIDKSSSFAVFSNSLKSDSSNVSVVDPTNEELTPEEAIGQSYDQIKLELAQELLIQIKSQSPQFFEQLVVDLLVAMGYGGSREDAGKAIGKSGDGGIDGVINEDRLGLDSVYLQAKRWDNAVGRPQIQAFAGGLDGVRARKGVFITTSTFASPAREYVKNIDKSIVLIDGKMLSNLMIEYNLGVTVTQTMQLKRIDVDYFESEL